MRSLVDRESLSICNTVNTSLALQRVSQSRQHKFHEHIRTQMLCETFASLTLLDPDHHTLAVDVRNFERDDLGDRPAPMPPCTWGPKPPPTGESPPWGSGPPLAAADTCSADNRRNKHIAWTGQLDPGDPGCPSIALSLCRACMSFATVLAQTLNPCGQKLRP